MSRKDKFLSKFDELNEKLSKSPLGKGLIDGGLSTLGPIGSGISSALSTRATILAEKNAKLFAEELKHRVDRINEKKLDIDFIKSDEFTTLFLEIMNNFARIHEQEKIRLFANIFTNSALREHSKTPYKEGFVRIIADLSNDHIILFSHVYQKCKSFTKQDLGMGREQVTVAELKELVEIPEQRILAYCEEISRYGLMYDWGIGKWSYERGSYGVTDYGFEFAEFLSEPY